jgi:hypothetical protein
MKEKIAVVVSIAAFFGLYISLDLTAGLLGVPTYIDYGETITVTRGSGRYSYDEDVSGSTTDVGMFILALSGMLAWRIFHWIKSGNLNGNIPSKSHTTWLYWLLGMTAYILITTPIWYIDISPTIQRVIVLACGAGIARFTYLKHEDAQRELRSGED